MAVASAAPTKCGGAEKVRQSWRSFLLPRCRVAQVPPRSNMYLWGCRSTSAPATPAPHSPALRAVSAQAANPARAGQDFSVAIFAALTTQAAASPLMRPEHNQLQDRGACLGLFCTCYCSHGETSIGCEDC
ncbi:hypothetical protein PWT90_00191 [Aphanocladium album]|nr:hypothetical protein PWT90_00191 [Aphanocladium album]